VTKASKDNPMEILLNHWEALFKCLQSLFSDIDSEILKDIIQESVIDLMKSKQLDSSEIKNPFAYLLKIGIRKTWKVLKDQDKQESIYHEVYDHNQSIHEHNEQRLLQEQAIQEILEAINHLTEKESKLLSLRFFSELSFKEIASSVGYSSSEVARNAMSRTLTHLRTIIRQNNKHRDWWLESPYFARFFMKKEGL